MRWLNCGRRRTVLPPPSGPQQLSVVWTQLRSRSTPQRSVKHVGSTILRTITRIRISPRARGDQPPPAGQGDAARRPPHGAFAKSPPDRYCRRGQQLADLAGTVGAALGLHLQRDSGRPDCAPSARATRYNPLRCPTGKTRHGSVNPHSERYSTLPKFGNVVCVAAARPKEEGRIAIVTNAGRTAVDVGHIGAIGFAGRATVSEGLAHTTGVIGVRQNRVVLTPGVCASSVCGDVVAQPGTRVSHPQGDGGNSASLPGESTT